MPMRVEGTREKQPDERQTGFDFSKIKEVVIETKLGRFLITETEDGINVNARSGQLILVRPVVGNEIDIVLGE